MSLRRRPWALLLVLLVGCGVPVAGPSVPDLPRPRPAVSPMLLAVPQAGPVAVPQLPAGDPYAAAVDSAARHGLQVWIETDLLARWLQGPAAFTKAVDRVGALALRRGVVGVKVADELGYRDGVAGRPELARQFLKESRIALRERVATTKVLIDLIVPELGCGPGLGTARVREECQRAARQRDPGLALTDVEALLRERNVDVLDLSTGLLSDGHYRNRGLTRDQAQRAAWQEVGKRRWQQLVELRARKALAHPDAYRGQAEADLATWVDLPLAHGAVAVDVWTWRQSYRDEVVRIMDPGLVPNALYVALANRRVNGVALMTHLTPSSLERGLEPDMAALARAFSEVLIAAGTG